MKYKDVFAYTDLDYYSQNKKQIQKDYSLKEYKAYEPKLKEDFYLRYFIFKILFEIDILDYEDFLDFHSNNCKDSIKFIKVLDRKVVPQIEEIIENAMPNFVADGNPNGTYLGDGFYEDEQRIIKYDYDIQSMYKVIRGKTFVAKYKKKLEVINIYISNVNRTKDFEKIKWIGGVSRMGVIFRELYEMQYIEAEVLDNGELNSSAFARKLFKVFDIKESKTWNTLSTYLRIDSQKYKETKRELDKNDFNIPM